MRSGSRWAFGRCVDFGRNGHGAPLPPAVLPVQAPVVHAPGWGPLLALSPAPLVTLGLAALPPAGGSEADRG